MADNDAEVQAARAYLQQASDKSGLNVYDHLSSVLYKLLDERPGNAADIIEEVSNAVKGSLITTDAGANIQNSPAVPSEVTLSEKHVALFKVENDGADDEEGTGVTNIPESMAAFESGGVGLGATESFRVFLAVKALLEQHPVQSPRFWGKILGIEANYFIVEAEYKPGEEPQPGEEDAAADEVAAEDEDEEEGDKLPKSQFKAPMKTPAEEYGQGCNKKAYFVCNQLGDAWAPLPMVTPAQIVVSRQIKKFFTGRLDAAITSYPPFPGTEANYLRAQIARISAATMVSPAGLYTFDPDADEDDEEARNTFITDEEFEGIGRAELADPGLTGWVHCTQYILPQGRCAWVNTEPPKEPTGDEEEDEEEEEDSGPEPETGPPLLQPLQDDVPLDTLPPWSPRVASAFHPAFACVVISSNCWPGAHAYCKGGKQFENIYVGFGQKYTSLPFSPAMPPAPGQEFAPAEESNELTEAADPTREEEEAYEASLLEAQEAAQDEEEGDGEDED